mgnify:CR=1 FL=1
MLNEKQKQFCNEYLIDFNGTQAAIRAGYSPKSAYSTANENLRKPEIQSYLKELIENRNERTKITQDDVIKDIIEVKIRCMQKAPVMFMGKQVQDESGNNLWKFDSQGATKALDMLAKHTGIYEIDNKQKNSVLNLAEAAAKIKEALK